MVGEPERTEKITVNLGPVDLGRIDLLVQEGFFTNRTDFIRSAVRAQLARSESAIQCPGPRECSTGDGCRRR